MFIICICSLFIFTPVMLCRKITTSLRSYLHSHLFFLSLPLKTSFFLISTSTMQTRCSHSLAAFCSRDCPRISMSAQSLWLALQIEGQERLCSVVCYLPFLLKCDCYLNHLGRATQLSFHPQASQTITLFFHYQLRVKHFTAI